jgi:hypothetical protein
VVLADYASFFTYKPGFQFEEAKIDALKPGESSVLPLRMDGHMIAEGYRITRLPDFKMNSVMFDTFAKEHVKVSNGICVLDHTSTEGYAKTHISGDGDSCVYAPHEAIALRPFIDESGHVTVGWTHRAVDAGDLRAVDKPESIEKQFELAMGAGATWAKKRFVGRV